MSIYQNAVRGSVTWVYCLVFLFALVCTVQAAVPPMLSYQGKLLQPSGATVPDGIYIIQFAIYDAPAGGTPLWSETNASIQVKSGLFATMLGSVVNLPANLFDSSNRFFAIKVGDDPEMTPRQQVASSAFAFRSTVAASVDDAAILTSKIANSAVTAEKLAPGVAIPPGGVIMWSGAVDQIPQGWALCDGQNGTPDLRDKFIVGAGAEYLVGATGGEKKHQLTVAEMPSHYHQMNTPEGIWYYGAYHFNVSSGGYDGNWGYRETNPTTKHTGGDQAHENRPPYYALCFIMKQEY